jgi:very-short-patch-repair endonuclease
MNIRPLFAIELDDRTHNLPNRIDRDKEVERILHGAGIPLIRIENRGRFDQRELARLVQNGIDNFARQPQ